MPTRSSIQEAISADETETPPRLYGDGVTDDSGGVAWYLVRGLALPILPEGATYYINTANLRRLLPAGFGGGFSTRCQCLPAFLAEKPRVQYQILVCIPHKRIAALRAWEVYGATIYMEHGPNAAIGMRLPFGGIGARQVQSGNYGKPNHSAARYGLTGDPKAVTTAIPIKAPARVRPIRG